jgi:hypothetical protein
MKGGRSHWGTKSPTERVVVKIREDHKGFLDILS